MLLAGKPTEGRRKHVRHQVCAYEREITARQPIAKNLEKTNENEHLSPLCCNSFPPEWNTLHRSETKQSSSRASLSASHAAHPSRGRLATDSVRVKLPSPSATSSEPRRPPRVKPGLHRGPRSPARQCWCSDCGVELHPV